MTWALCLLNFREEAFLGRVFRSNAEKIYRELTVDVVKLMFVFPVRFFEVFRIYIFQVTEIAGAFRVHAFVDNEVFALLLRRKGMPAVRAQQTKRSSHEITGGECLPADLALILALAALLS